MFTKKMRTAALTALAVPALSRLDHGTSSSGRGAIGN